VSQSSAVPIDAATRHQILLFSGHPEKWCDLGLTARSLESLKA
jgi:hypothetical protein